MTVNIHDVWNSNFRGHDGGERDAMSGKVTAVTNIFRALTHMTPRSYVVVCRLQIWRPLPSEHHKRHRWRYTGHLLPERSSVAVFWSWFGMSMVLLSLASESPETRVETTIVLLLVGRVLFHESPNVCALTVTIT